LSFFAWQEMQVLGVPFHLWPAWQLMHATAECWPVSEKPVEL
jgi:hypothetical protein